MKKVETTIKNIEKYNSFESPKFPILYENELWEEKDCHEDFLSLYDDKYMINSEGGIYFSDDLYIFPDGHMGDSF